MEGFLVTMRWLAFSAVGWVSRHSSEQICTASRGCQNGLEKKSLPFTQRVMLKQHETLAGILEGGHFSLG